MVLKDTGSVHVYISKKIKRKLVGVVVSGPKAKEYKVVFKKCRLMENFDYFPCRHD